MKATQEFNWQEIKGIWNESNQGQRINIQMTELLDELKGKTSRFEKDLIQSDLAVLNANWNKAKGRISQFERDSVDKDLTIISRFLRRLFDLLGGKKR